MKLLRTSIHYLDLPTGEKVKYLRLMCRAGRTIIGRSVLTSRFSLKFVARIEASGGTKGLVVGPFGNCANVQ